MSDPLTDPIAAVYLGAESAALAVEPEGYSVLVDVRGYPGVDPAVVAPLVAKHLEPAMSFGRVLHLEPGEERGLFYVVVEVLQASFADAIIGRPAPAER